MFKGLVVIFIFLFIGLHTLGVIGRAVAGGDIASIITAVILNLAIIGGGFVLGIIIIRDSRRHQKAQKRQAELEATEDRVKK